MKDAVTEPGLATVTRWREQSPDPRPGTAGSWMPGGADRKR